MKKVLLLLVITAGIIAGCDPNVSDMKPQPEPPKPDAPVITSVKSDTPYYKQAAHLTVAATGADQIAVEGVKAEGGLYTTGALTGPTTVTVSATGKGGTTTKSFTIPVWSERMTFMCTTGEWKWTTFKVCREDSVQYPSAWVDRKELITPVSIQYYPDGSGYNINNGSKWLIPVHGWSFKNGETVFTEGTYDWTIDTLTATKIVYHRIAESPQQPGVYFRTLHGFTH